MSRFPRRGRLARLALGLVALGVPFVGASAAQAAMGTSPTFVPQNRPALTSVTQTTPSTVNFCFATSGGQAITAPPGGFVANNFALGGYDSSFFQGAVTATQFNNNCVEATYALGTIDDYTYGAVNGGNFAGGASAVVAIIAGNPVGNLTDSAPLIGSDSENGTRNLTTGLDLLSAVPLGSNRMAFAFDQDVRQDNLPANCPGATCPTRDFLYYDGGGVLHGNTAAAQAVISISGNIVVVQYSNPPDPIADARIAVVRGRAEVNDPGGPTGLRADTPFGGSSRVSFSSAPVGGVAGSGNTSLIEQTGAALVNGGNSNQIDHTFENPVAAGAASPNCFVAILSNNRQLFGDSVSVSGNTVRVTYNGLQTFSEMAVRAGVNSPDPGPVPPGTGGTIPAVNTNCVQSVTGAVPNTIGTSPVGGNIGGKGTGYSTGAEALASNSAGALSKSGGDVSVPIDQRIDPSTIILGNVLLLDSQGNAIGAPPSNASVLGNGSPTDPHTIVFTFDPITVASARGMQWNGTQFGTSALFTFPTAPVDEFSSEAQPVQTFSLPG